MARPARSNEPNGYHHVTNRGARRYDTFIDDADRESFLELLVEACERHGTKLVAYCLMGNHFHLVLHCTSGELSATVHDFASKYVRRFNLVHGFDGPLFKTRFHNTVITSDVALNRTTRYVHRNPLDLGLEISRYRWSSYGVYLGLVRCPSWLHPSTPTMTRGGSQPYKQFVESDFASDKVSIVAGVGRQAAQPRGVERYAHFAAIDSAVAALLGVPPEVLTVGGRGRQNTARSVAALVAVERGVDGGALMTHYGFASASAVRTTISRARNLVESDPTLGSVVRTAIERTAPEQAA